ncbi:UDP binding domain-containing protein [Luteococcus japonicus]|uniref:UDP-glucose dehydrogenase n=1 Tax=Luteococcus japonicus LSP_Lj1 TaxID=1255658 RepID=A0A1R4JPJ5_9ACTN|nr:UDP binding domain-containing protein [Luteococcus japonicus]SJN33926.1 UDP-glucose dehydrogenase [Luteococcus japonicus LSP_Lj1]
MAKLTENAFRDVNIAFANELSLISDKLGIDVWELIEPANKHPRVNILQSGPGVGGHCIAVDPWFIVSTTPEEARLIRTAREVNDAKPAWVVEQVRKAVELHPGAVVACLGLAFKADIEDLREAPSIAIVQTLAKELTDAKVIAVEPHVDALPKSLAGRGVDLMGLDEALEQADVVVLLVDHTVFKNLDRTRLADHVVIDTKGLWR